MELPRRGNRWRSDLCRDFASSCQVAKRVEIDRCNVARRIAQQRPVPVIGFLMGVQVPANLVSAFREGLGERGYVEGQSVAFDLRSAGGDYNRFRTIADEFVHRQVATIFTPVQPEDPEEDRNAQ
jgi:ABC-type uncharacterized transport system substrate-binding protein